jgi:hypothetical protein
MTSVNFPFIWPPTSQEWFCFVLGFFFACILFSFFIHDVKPKQIIQRIAVIVFLIVVFLLATFWRT